MSVKNLSAVGTSQTTERSDVFHLDSILKAIGEFGLYQVKLFLVVGAISAYAYGVTVVFTFVGFQQTSRCFVSGCDNATTPFDAEFVEWTIPNGGNDACRQYKRLPMDRNAHQSSFHTELSLPPGGQQQNVKESDWGGVAGTSELGTEDNCSPRDSTCAAACFSLNTTNQVESCHGHYVYDKSHREDSVTSEYGLVCENHFWLTVGWSVYMVGRLIGAVTLGVVSDKYGRKIALLFSLFIVMGLGMVSTAFHSLVGFLILRMLVGLGDAGIFQSGFVLLTELTGPKRRTAVGMLVQGWFAIGGSWVSLAGYFIRRWIPLQLVIHGAGVVFVFCYWWLPESPRYLMAKGRVKEAYAIVHQIAKVNGKPVPEHMLPDPDQYEHSQVVDEQKKLSILNVFRTGPSAIQYLIVCYCWFVNVLVYYGLTLKSVELSSDPYLGLALSSSMEIPAAIITIWLLAKAGRRLPFAGFMFFGGVACIVAGFLTDDLEVLRLFLSLLGKLCISCSFDVAYLYTAEMYPTAIRNSSIGTASMTARVGGIIAPFIADLETISEPLPLVIMGSTAVLSGFLALNLPETKGIKLPETMEESDELTSRSLQMFKCFRR